MIYGWISPEGKIYECDFMSHYDLACELIKFNNYNTIFNGNNESADDILIYHYGWIKCYASIFDRNHIQLCMPFHITEDQKKILLEDFLKNPNHYDKTTYWILEEYNIIEPTYDERGMKINPYTF